MHYSLSVSGSGLSKETLENTPGQMLALGIGQRTLEWDEGSERHWRHLLLTVSCIHSLSAD